MKPFIKYVLIAFIFFSCNIKSDNKGSAGPTISTEVIDTIKTRPANLDAKPVLFEAAFIKGTTQRVKTLLINYYGITIGKIKIVSGHIIICDPLHIDEYGIPFTQLFPTGEFPVQLAIAKLGEEESIAFARINFSNEPVERWEFALQAGQAPISVGGKEKHGYAVDFGIAIFMDEDAKRIPDINGLTETDAALYKNMGKHYHNRWKYTMYDFGKYNLAAFTTGFGDGHYATYIGFDAQGKPCRLLTDFNLFDAGRY